jgi:hypothetical protein
VSRLRPRARLLNASNVISRLSDSDPQYDLMYQYSVRSRRLTAIISGKIGR